MSCFPLASRESLVSCRPAFCLGRLIRLVGSRSVSPCLWRRHCFRARLGGLVLAGSVSTETQKGKRGESTIGCQWSLSGSPWLRLSINPPTLCTTHPLGGEFVPHLNAFEGRELR